jgi:hypothetical protein
MAARIFVLADCSMLSSRRLMLGVLPLALLADGLSQLSKTKASKPGTSIDMARWPWRAVHNVALG